MAMILARGTRPIQLGLADLLRAKARLQATDSATLTELAAMMGLQADAPRHVASGAMPALKPVHEQDKPPPAARPVPKEAAQRDADMAGPGAPGASVRVRLAPAGKAPARAGATPAWAAGVTAMPRAQAQPPQVPEPLLLPQRQRALLGALAAHWAEGDEWDEQRLVSELTERRLPEQPPLRKAWTLRHGLQVLVDRSAAMAPFDLDAQALLGLLGRLLPPERLQVLYFAGNPGQGCLYPGEEEPAPWRAPPVQTPVLLLTSLGLGPAAGLRGQAAGWAQFVAALRQARQPVRALLPHAPTRWPQPLARQLHALHWSRTLRAAEVRRVLR